MKYIDADKLIAEIEKLLAKAKNDELKAFAKKDAAGHLIAVTKTAICVKIKKLVASLQQEQPEIDLEKAARNVYESWMGGTMDDVRRDMVELGKVLNARKEE